VNYRGIQRSALPEGDSMKFDDVLQSIGNTPHIRMKRLFGDANV